MKVDNIGWCSSSPSILCLHWGMVMAFTFPSSILKAMAQQIFGTFGVSSWGLDLQNQPVGCLVLWVKYPLTNGTFLCWELRQQKRGRCNKKSGWINSSCGPTGSFKLDMIGWHRWGTPEIDLEIRNYSYFSKCRPIFCLTFPREVNFNPDIDTIIYTHISSWYTKCKQYKHILSYNLY